MYISYIHNDLLSVFALKRLKTIGCFRNSKSAKSAKSIVMGKFTYFGFITLYLSE